MTDWLWRWENGQIGWHQADFNARLIEFIDCLGATSGVVFVPLSGASLDMIYLLERGFKVVGVEVSKVAVERFFTENNLTYTKNKIAKFTLYEGPNIKIYCGDFFALDADKLSEVTAVYDRASLIALPFADRIKYAQHLTDIIPPDCRILLLALNYPQSQMDGPPYALGRDEVKKLFQIFEYKQLQCFDDLKNEPKFLSAGVDFLEKATYCLRKKEDK